MSKTSEKRDKILAHLQTGKTLSQAQAEDLFGQVSLKARVKELRNLNHNIVTVKVDEGGKRVSAYILKQKLNMKPRTKLVIVSEETHLGVKQLSIQKAMAGQHMKEGEIYSKAVELGLKALASKVK